MRTPTRIRAAAAALLTTALVSMAAPATAGTNTPISIQDDFFTGSVPGALVKGNVLANDTGAGLTVTGLKLIRKEWCYQQQCELATFDDPTITPDLTKPDPAGDFTADFGTLVAPYPADGIAGIATYTVNVADADGHTGTSTLRAISPAKPASTGTQTIRDDVLSAQTGHVVSGSILDNDEGDGLTVTELVHDGTWWGTSIDSSMPGDTGPATHTFEASGRVVVDFGPLPQALPDQWTSGLRRIAGYTATVRNANGDTATQRVIVMDAPLPTPAPPLPVRAWDLMLSLEDGREWPGGTASVSMLQEWATGVGLRIADVRLIPGQVVQYAPSEHADPPPGGINDPVWTGPAPTDDDVLSLADPASWSWSAAENHLGAASPAGHITIGFPQASLDGPWELEDDPDGRFCPRPVTIIKTLVDIDVVSNGGTYAHQLRTYRVPVSERITGTPVPADDGCGVAAADDVVTMAAGTSLAVPLPVLANDMYAGAPIVELDDAPAGLNPVVANNGAVEIAADASLAGQTVSFGYRFLDVNGTWRRAAARVFVTIEQPATDPEPPTPTPTPDPEPPTPPTPTPEGPKAVDDKAVEAHDVPVQVPVLRNDQWTGDAKVELVKGSVTAGVRAAVRKGVVVLTAPERYAGKTVTVRYRLTDESDKFDVATIRFRVKPVVDVDPTGADLIISTPATASSAPADDPGWTLWVALLAGSLALGAARLRGRREP